MGLNCGIIGLPNVGKSTFFNRLTNLCVPAENFPFCTIKPNIGIVPVLDERLRKIFNIIRAQKIIYSSIKFIDIAGLVKGAAVGEGLGNNFLQNIKEVDAIIHIVRCFKDSYVTHMYGEINPIKDAEIINTELLLSDLEVCEKSIKKIKRLNFTKNNIIHERNIFLKYCSDNLKKGIALRNVVFPKKYYFFLKEYNFLTYKPMMYILNISEIHDKNVDFNKIFNFFKNENVHFTSIIIKKNSKKECKNAISYKKFNKNTSLQEIIKLSFQLLNLKTFFTAGVKEVRSWIFKNGSTALEASNLIHTDIAKGFIKAKVISYNDFLYSNTLKVAQELGKIRYEGKKYIVQDGDIMHFLFKI